jgi:hypothetical protein
VPLSPTDSPSPNALPLLPHSLRWRMRAIFAFDVCRYGLRVTLFSPFPWPWPSTTAAAPSHDAARRSFCSRHCDHKLAPEQRGLCVSAMTARTLGGSGSSLLVELALDRRSAVLRSALNRLCWQPRMRPPRRSWRAARWSLGRARCTPPTARRGAVGAACRCGRA